MDSRLGGLLLVHNTTKGDALLYAYPSKRKPVTITKQPEHSNVTFQKTNQNEKIKCTVDSWDYMCGLPDNIIAHLFNVKQSLMDQPFDLKINSTRFVSYPVQVLQRNEAALQDVPPTLSIALYFVLHASASKSLITTCQNLSKQIALALLNEERRCGYISRQAHQMLACIEHQAQRPECDMVDPYMFMTKRSQLARHLKHVYDDFNAYGLVDMDVNDVIRISLCLPQRVAAIKGLPETTALSIESQLRRVRPYHSVLLIDSVADIIDSLPCDASPSLIQFLNVCTPLRSLQQLTGDADLPYAQVFVLLRELLLWVKALIILPLSESNVYRLSELATPTPYLRQAFADCYDIPLPIVLSMFSQPLALKHFLQPVRFDDVKRESRVGMILWLLRRQLIVQEHTYIYLMESPSLQMTLQSDGCSMLTLTPLLAKAIHTLDTDMQTAIVYEAGELSKRLPLKADFEREQDNLARIIPYAHGKLHLEEIMYKLNMRHCDILRSLDCWQAIFVFCHHE